MQIQHMQSSPASHCPTMNSCCWLHDVRIKALHKLSLFSRGGLWTSGVCMCVCVCLVWKTLIVGRQARNACVWPVLQREEEFIDPWIRYGEPCNLGIDLPPSREHVMGPLQLWWYHWLIMMSDLLALSITEQSRRLYIPFFKAVILSQLHAQIHSS